MQDGKMRRVSLPLCERAAGVHGALLGDGSQLRVYRLGLKRGQVKVTCLWVSARDHLTRNE